MNRFPAFAFLLLALPAAAQTAPQKPVPAAPEKPAQQDKQVPNLPTDENVEEPEVEEKVKAPKKPTVIPPPPSNFGEAPKTDGVILQALDKITAKITPITAPIGQTVRFRSLEITARACNMRPPEEEPESAAFLEIDDVGHDGKAKRVFSGWMFASSPALSALEHPTYDVWVKSCKIASPAPPSAKR